jgi:hypothetical protein
MHFLAHITSLLKAPLFLFVAGPHDSIRHLLWVPDIQAANASTSAWM